MRGVLLWLNARAGSTGPAREADRLRSLAADALALLLGTSSALLIFALCIGTITPLTWEHGGMGGAAAQAVCSEGSHVVGAQVFLRNELVAGISLVCQSERSSAPSRERALLGVRTSTWRELACASDALAVGIWGRAGSLVDRFSLICAPRAEPHGPASYLEAAGGDGGAGFHARCLKGALRGLRGRVGDLLDRVGTVCDGDDA